MKNLIITWIKLSVLVGICVWLGHAFSGKTWYVQLIAFAIMGVAACIIDQVSQISKSDQ